MRMGSMNLTLLIFLVFSVYSGRVQGQCPDGFGGSYCSICQSDDGCRVQTASDTATCSNTVNYTTTSVQKFYSCELKPGGNALVDLESLLEPGSLLISCTTGAQGSVINITSDSPRPVAGAPTGAPAAETPAPEEEDNGNGFTDTVGEFLSAIIGRRLLQAADGEAAPTASPASCNVRFTVKDPGVEVRCEANDCAIKPDSIDPVVCSQTTCFCPASEDCQGESLISALVGSVEGKTELACKDTGDCVLKLEGLLIDQLDMTCQYGECLVPASAGGNNTFNGTEVVSNEVENLDINPIIASIPTIVLVLLVTAIGIYAMRQPVMHWPPTTGGASPSGSWKEKMAASEGAAVEALQFTDISVHLPMTRKTALERRNAIVGKAMNERAPLGATRGKVQNLLHTAADKLHRLGSGGMKLTPAEGQLISPNNTQADTEAAAGFVAQLHDGPSEGSWYIVQDCSGTFKGGELVGVLGPSGCGKTTFLGSLVGSPMDLGPTAVLNGQVTINGQQRREHEMAYVPQADLFIPTLTVKECLWYSASLRLPKGTPAEEVSHRVESTLYELGLSHVADVQVGGSGGVRGVSGGERRRVTIGMELVTDPHIIVLDEPSSGLDSYTAINLMDTLRRVAAKGRVVVASLHQPSRDMFDMLDQAVLMGHGRILYMGPPGQADTWFADRGMPCPENLPIAEHMLEIANSASQIKNIFDAEKKLAGLGVPIDASATPFAGGAVTTTRDVENQKPPLIGATPSKSSLAGDTSKDPGLLMQLSVMFWRSLTDILRNPMLLLLHAGVSLFVGVVAGMIFWDLPATSIGVQNRMGATFFALAFLGFTSLTTVDLLMNERAVVVREVRSGYYAPVAYLTSKVVLDGILLRLLPAVLYWAPFYYMAGFRIAAAYAATYVLTLMLFNLAVGAMSMAVTVASNTAGQASFTMNFLLLFSLIFTGFLVNVSAIPDFARWLHYLSLFYYAFEAMVTTELTGTKLDFIYQPSATQEPIRIPNIKGETFLTTLGFQTDTVTLNICILIAFYVGFVLLALIIFLFRLPRQRRSGKGLLGRMWTKA